VFTHGALLQIEELSGIDVLVTGLRFSASLSARMLRTILYVALTDAGAPITQKQAAELLSIGNLNRIRAILASAWNDSMPLPDPGPPAPAGSISRLTWIQAWAIARQDLGLSDEEWLAMTPRMVQVLGQQRLERQRETELMFAMIVANTINFSSCHPDKAVLPREFMLHPWPERPERPVSSIDVAKAFARVPKVKQIEGKK
jgi:hypothetical protein